MMSHFDQSRADLTKAKVSLNIEYSLKRSLGILVNMTYAKRHKEINFCSFTAVLRFESMAKNNYSIPFE